jgi:hypothetical protein
MIDPVGSMRPNGNGGFFRQGHGKFTMTSADA